MRKNIDIDEHIIASLPKVWSNEVGISGFFSKSREGILVLTNKNIFFVPQYLYITPKEMPKYYGQDEAKVTQIDGYSETQLDEDLSEKSKSLIIDLKSITNVEGVLVRKVHFLRVKFRIENKIKAYDFGIAKSVTNYPIRQPLMFYSIDWEQWVRLIKSYI